MMSAPTPSPNGPGLSIRSSTRYFNYLKWYLVPPDFKECCIRYTRKCSNFNKKKVPPVNTCSAVLVDLKNIESPDGLRKNDTVKIYRLIQLSVNSRRVDLDY